MFVYFSQGPGGLRKVLGPGSINFHPILVPLRLHSAELWRNKPGDMYFRPRYLLGSYGLENMRKDASGTHWQEPTRNAHTQTPSTKTPNTERRRSYKDRCQAYVLYEHIWQTQPKTCGIPTWRWTEKIADIQAMPMGFKMEPGWQSSAWRPILKRMVC